MPSERVFVPPTLNADAYEEASELFEPRAGVELNDRTRAWKQAAWVPPVNVYEDEEQVVIELDAAGIDPSELEITLEGRTLTIEGARRQTAYGGARGTYRLLERPVGRFARSFDLPDELLAAGGAGTLRVERYYDGGVLILRLLKGAEEAEERNVGPPAGAESLPESPDAVEGEVDLNHQAYLRDAAELERSHSGCVVAYADGRRIAEGKDARELAARIPEGYRGRPLFIKDVPSRPLKFQRPARFGRR